MQIDSFSQNILLYKINAVPILTKHSWYTMAVTFAVCDIIGKLAQVDFSSLSISWIEDLLLL